MERKGSFWSPVSCSFMSRRHLETQVSSVCSRSPAGGSRAAAGSERLAPVGACATERARVVCKQKVFAF